MDSQTQGTASTDQQEVARHAQGWQVLPHPASAAQGLQFEPTWLLAGQAVAVAEEIDDLQRELSLLPEELPGQPPDLSAVVVAAVVPAVTAMAVPGLAGGEPRWLAAAIGAVAMGLAGAGGVWLAQRRATNALGHHGSGSSAVAAGLMMATVAGLVAATVAWPQAIGLDGPTARWLLAAAAAALLSGWACASGAAEAAQAAAYRCAYAKLLAERQWRLKQLAGQEATLAEIWTALPVAHGAGRGCIAQYERLAARRELATAWNGQADDMSPPN